MMCKHETQNKIHCFEKAGLGKAPFRCVGVYSDIGPHRMAGAGGVTIEVGSPGQPMGTCKFCGQGIADCYQIRSADGKEFTVGCDCVRKTGDAGMRKVVDALVAKKNREKREAKGVADAAYLRGLLADPAIAERLNFKPTPDARSTVADSVAWMLDHCGNAGLARTARWVRGILAESKAVIQ